MQPISSWRESVIELPWETAGRVLAAVLTSDEWSSDREQLVGRTNIHFVVAVRGIEVAAETLRFPLIADSPDLRHPLTGSIELCALDDRASTLRVGLRADLAEEFQDHHLTVRESIASLADVLSRTIAAAAAPPLDDAGVPSLS